MSRWFRMYDEVLDDPKVQKLPPPLFKAWVNLLCIASRNGGVLPPVEDVAFALRVDEDTAAGWMQDLWRRGLIDDDGGIARPHNWNERQFRSDRDPTAAARQARKRERDKGLIGRRDVTDRGKTEATVTDNKPSRVTHGKESRVTSRPPDTDTETETDSEAAAQLPRGRMRELDELEAKLRSAAGLDQDPTPTLMDLSPIIGLLQHEVDLEEDILPAIRAKAARSKARPKSWGFYTDVILEYRARRLAPVVLPDPTAGGSGGFGPSKADIHKAQYEREKRALDRMEAEKAAREAAE